MINGRIKMRKFGILLTMVLALFVMTKQAKADTYTYEAGSYFYNVVTPTCNDVYGRIFRGCVEGIVTDTTTNTQTTEVVPAYGFNVKAGKTAVHTPTYTNGVYTEPANQVCPNWTDITNFSENTVITGLSYVGGVPYVTGNITVIDTWKGGCTAGKHTMIESGLNTPESNGVTCPQVAGSGQTTMGPSYAVDMTLDGVDICH
jgi:hypothetical protein